MTLLLFGIIIGLALAFGVVALFLGFHLRSLLDARKHEQLALLEQYNDRLQLIVSDLLSKADEMDKATLYVKDDLDPDTEQLLADTCSELVLLGDVASSIDHLLKTKDVNASRRALLHACELAAKDSRRLREIKHTVRDLERKRLGAGPSDAT